MTEPVADKNWFCGDVMLGWCVCGLIKLV